MTTRNDFTPDEWTALHRGVTGSGLLVSLSDVVDQNLADILPQEERTALESWRRTDRTGYIFLDSVDESRLRKSDDFRKALKSTRYPFSVEEMARLRIFISSRTTAWRSLSDVELVREALGPYADYKEVLSTTAQMMKKLGIGSSDAEDTATKDQKPDAIECYRILELNLGQVKQYATAKGVAEADDFVEALRTSHAEWSATRPADVEVLVNYWKTHKNLGTLSELMAYHVDEHLHESAKRRADDQAPHDKLRDGAEQLAAVTILAKRTDFNLLGTDATAEGLDVSAGLPTWSDAEVSALLQRPIFDSEYMGRIKFHHRNTSEYLAACWFRDLMVGGLLLPQVVRRLFASTPTGLILRPSLAPVAAWLCCFSGFWTETLQGLMVKYAPEAFLQYGDPAALTPAYRAKILHALAHKLGANNFASVDTSPQILARLADESLVPIVADIIRNVTLGNSIRRCAFLIAYHGKLPGTVDACLEAVEAPDADLKDYAFEIIKEHATGTQRQRLLAWIHAQERLPQSWLAELVDCVYPAIIDEVEVAAIFAKGRIYDRRYVSDYRLNLFVDKVQAQRLTALIRMVVQLINTPPYINPQPSHLPMSADHAWLVPLLSKMLGRLLKDGQVDQEVLPVYAQALSFIDDSRRFMITHEGDRQDFSALTRAHRELRRATFLQMLETYPNEQAWNIAFHFLPADAIVRFDVGDVDWLVEELGPGYAPRAREAALRLLEMLYEGTGYSRALRKRIRNAVADDAMLTQLATVVTPTQWKDRVRRFWYRKVVNTFGQPWWWSHRMYSLRQLWSEVHTFLYLNWHYRVVASGKNPHLLRYVLITSRQKDDGLDKLGLRDWSGVARRYWPLVAWATLKGSDRCWRRFQLPLPFAREPPNSIHFAATPGLAYLDLKVSDSAFWEGLTDPEVRNATCYAINEINGFAEWLPELYRLRQGVVGALLQEAVVGEYSFPPTREHVHHVTAALAAQDAAPELVHAVGARVADLLRAGDPPHPAILRYCMRIVIQDLAMTREEAATLAQTRIVSYQPAQEQFVLWLTLWMQVNATAALNYVDGLDPELRARMVATLCSGMVGDDVHSAISVSDPSYMEPAILRRFVPMALVVARTEPKMIPGQVVWGGPRDQSGRMSAYLLQKLAADPRPEALAVLKELHGSPDLQPERDWIGRLLTQRLLTDAETEALTPKEVADFASDIPQAPRNAGELYDRALDALDHIKYMVELSDDSWRHEVNPTWHETDLRGWLAGKFRQVGAGRYITTEEPEDAAGNRADIRILNASVPQNTTIELKWAGRWSYVQHLERLENQLCVQYLHGESRHGIYLLVDHGDTPTSWGQTETGQNRTLDDLRATLEMHAAAMLAKYPGIRGLKVVSINCNEIE